MFALPTSTPRTDAPPTNVSCSAERVWWCAVVLFIVAGATGALFRYGMVYGWPEGLSLENIRHAHSHLMYFGWGTPALMALIWRSLPVEPGARLERAFRWVAGSTLVAAILAYPLFLLFGYSPVEIGSARLPIAVVGASLNMICWYGFVGLYIAATHHRPRTGALRLWDVAIGALVLATLGAWSLALLPAVGLHNPLMTTALTHVFLDLFSEGWFVLGALGVAFAVLHDPAEEPASWAVWLVILGLPFTFLLGMPEARLPAGMAVVGRSAGLLVGAGLLGLTLQLTRTLPSGPPRWLWGVPLGFLGLKASAQVTASVVPGLWLGGSHGLRVLYLHLMLLGFLTLALLAAARILWRRVELSDVAAFYGTVGILLTTLVPLTGWMAGGVTAYNVAIWAALGPIAAAVWILARTASGVGRPTVHPPPTVDSS